MKNIILILVLCQTLLLVLTAAPITWEPVEQISDATDVSTHGTVVEAFNAGDVTAGDVIVNGVTFTGNATLLSQSSAVDAFNGSTGDASYDTLLSNIDFGNGGDLVTLTIGADNLVVGSSYEVQVWFVDTRNARTMRFGDGESSESTADVSNGMVTGTFIADGISQSLTLDAQGFGNAHMNAYQLRTLPSAPLPPSIPANLIANPGDELVSLNWDDNDQFGFSNFIIYRALASGGPYSQIATTTDSNYTDTDVTNGITYFYVVSAVNSEDSESAVSSEVSATPAVGITPPNFIFIITDDQDIYSIGAYRNLEPVELDSNGLPYVVDTPNIDRLANEGMIFHQARIMGSRVGAVCTGSRTSIMTGKNAWDNNTDVPGSVTFPAIFNEGVRSGNNSRPYATYRTCKNGNSFSTANNEFSVRNDATRRGNTDGNGSEWHKDRALEHIEHWRANHQANGTPFFMYLGFSHPHDERNAREDPALTTRYGCVNTVTPETLVVNQAAPPLPINHLSATPDTFPAHPFDNSHLGVRDEVSVPGVLQYRNEAVVRNEIGRQLACVDWIDRQLEIVFDRLEDPNNDGDSSDSLLDNTYIVFTSDHGMSIGRHGLMGKQNLYDHTWRVPYIVRGPGIAPGSSSDALIYLHDTFPTFCDLAGIDIPSSIDDNDGRSFRSVLEGEGGDHRDKVYGMYAGGSKPGIRAITDGRFKLIKYDVEDSDTQVTQMFDLQTNPFELLPEHGTPNIADSLAYAVIRNQLEAEMMSERVLNNDPDPFLGDKTLFRFEDGNANDSPVGHLDEFAFNNDAVAKSGTNGSLPVLKADVPSATEFVLGDFNTLSLEFDQDLQHYLEVSHSDRAINFGEEPFTIEAWVKLESLPTGNDFTSTMPVVMKKVIGSNDSDLDYLFLAAAGHYGSNSNFDHLAVHLGDVPIISSLSIPDTNWHFISVAIDPSNNTLRFTMDDQVDTQTVTDFGTANNGPLIIGAHFDSASQIDSSFDGCIDELMITDGFVSLAQLQPLTAVSDDDDLEIIDHTFDFDGSIFKFTFTSNETNLYTLERSTTLKGGEWVAVPEFTLIPGASGSSTTTIDLPTDPESKEREFFRIVTE